MMTNLKQVILVDRKDNAIGTQEKLKAHQQGQLHRAFSVFVFNSKGELLLQKRAQTKYHSPGLWSNTCCSHPRPGKGIKNEAEKRLQQEMGIKCPLKEVFSFYYKVKLGDLTENEIDHVFLCKFEDAPTPNSNEVEDWKWITIQELNEDISRHPEKYTFWLKKILQRPDLVWRLGF